MRVMLRAKRKREAKTDWGGEMHGGLLLPGGRGGRERDRVVIMQRGECGG